MKPPRGWIDRILTFVIVASVAGLVAAPAFAFFFEDSPEPATIPEPGTLGILALGLVAAVVLGRRK